MSELLDFVRRTTLKPIETRYDGYRFRSRLEARWAVFFNSAGIKYQYEPEGFLLPDGTRYLPDFYLPEVGGRAGANGLYVEVKGVLDDKDRRKLQQFSGVGSRYPLLVVGEIPLNAEQLYEHGAYCDGLFWNCRTIDGDYYPVQFWRDPDGDIGIWGYDNVKKYPGDIAGFNWFNQHFKAAREARFEYGECPRRIK